MTPEPRPGDVAGTHLASSDALPCPFCQQSFVACVVRHSKVKGLYTYQLMCNNSACEMLASTPPKASPDLALALWNYRGPEVEDGEKTLEQIPIEDCYKA